MATATGSDFNVEVVRVTGITKHPNADRLSFAKVNGVETVFKTTDFKEGDLAVFVPVDALVPVANPEFSFLASKSHPERTHARIKAMKLRGMYSEGMLVPYAILPNANGIYGEGPAYTEGTNVQDILGIKKHETGADKAENIGSQPVPGSKRSAAKRLNELVPIYKVDSFYRCSSSLPGYTRFVLTEKIHGSNARFGYVKSRFYVGSHRTLRSVSSHRLVEWAKRVWKLLVRGPSGYYADTLGDIWLRIANQYNLETICRTKLPGKVIYGEVYGKGVQTRGGVEFVYDAGDGLGFRVFDIFDTETKTFMPYDLMEATCIKLGLPVVPFVQQGWYYKGDEPPASVVEGPSYIGNHIREGVVLRTDVKPGDQRNVLKLVSKAYKMLENDSDA